MRRWVGGWEGGVDRHMTRRERPRSPPRGRGATAVVREQGGKERKGETRNANRASCRALIHQGQASRGPFRISPFAFRLFAYGASWVPTGARALYHLCPCPRPPLPSSPPRSAPWRATTCWSASWGGAAWAWSTWGATRG